MRSIERFWIEANTADQLVCKTAASFLNGEFIEALELSDVGVDETWGARVALAHWTASTCETPGLRKCCSSVCIEGLAADGSLLPCQPCLAHVEAMHHGHLRFRQLLGPSLRVR